LEPSAAVRATSDAHESPRESAVSLASVEEPVARTAASTSDRPLVALNGYCPVALLRNGRWTRGDVRWTVVHDGWIYRLSGPAEREQFLANPNAFEPACSGNDPVVQLDSQRTVPGQPTYCAAYRGRLYMFSSAATQLRFNEDPQRYVPEARD
jgi:YHS domain-containing protein